jgi:hypothetical protein
VGFIYRYNISDCITTELTMGVFSIGCAGVDVTVCINNDQAYVLATKSQDNQQDKIQDY